MSTSRSLILLAFFAVAACGAADAGEEAVPGGQTGAVADTTPAPAATERSDGPVDVTDLGYDRGDPEAPIRVIEFSDFGCGYCRKFHQETFPSVAEEYIETGKVAWKYVPFILGIFPNSVEAAVAGECAGEQGRFAAMRERLFDDQSEWRSASEPFTVFGRFAREEGLDVERFRRCVDEGWREERLQESVQAGQRVGVRGTPTFVINGFPVQGALPVSVFRDVFEQLLEEAGAPER